ncbi:hypothetical protein BaRGS_00018538 [Batillaria attramentaria]|uniref:Uncharacterized protein n=1 Tax=Batillaria attramentaria TaxID=370345 RepID=A0ABD0KSF3_9CAEN
MHAAQDITRVFVETINRVCGKNFSSGGNGEGGGGYAFNSLGTAFSRLPALEDCRQSAVSALTVFLTCDMTTFARPQNDENAPSLLRSARAVPTESQN